ncbi:MAG TPA: L,D-transpeptidase family protein [Gemmatimonadales bacterium]|jgi:murein L,D-transpeptidase YcbB/YkuD
MSFLRLTRRMSGALALAVLLVSHVSAQDSVGVALRGLVIGESDVWRLYASRGWAPVWLAGHGLSSQGTAAIAQLRDAASHGLRPNEYATAALDSAIGRLALPGTSAATLARTDLLLSTAMLQYLEDLHLGRARFAPFSRSPAESIDWPAALTEAVAADTVARLVLASEPRLTQYRNLRALLIRYRLLAAGPPQPIVPDGPSVWPGAPYPGTDALRRRLQLEEKLPPASSTDRAGVYDDSLAAAVRRFQLRHGLRPDALLGPQTLAALNTPLAHRVHQIELALERLRWLPRLGAQPFVVVNIPAFELFAFDSAGGSGTPALTMKVVVGKALDTRTPMLLEPMRYVEFRPFWNVPRSILTAEVIPVLRRNAGYLRTHGMELVDKRGRPLGDRVTPDVIRRLAEGQLRVRQRPGRSNALGLVKFVFPNAADVYMHDTPETDLFSQARRDFSHGCIRLENPAALAAWVLRGRTEWTPDRIAAAMTGTETIRVPLTRPMPVAVFYTTVVAMPDGTARFYPDIYGRDQTLDELLGSPLTAGTGIADASLR